MRSPVTIYISQVLHQKKEIFFFTKQGANAVFNAICILVIQYLYRQ